MRLDPASTTASLRRWRLRLAAFCLVVLGAAAGGGAARAETVTVSAFALGRTQQDAVDKALVQALEQVTGVRLQSARALEESLASVTVGQQNVTVMSERFQQTMRQQSGGLVRGFQITSIEPEAGGFMARLSVDVERFVAPGLPTQDRRRIFVADPVDLTGRVGANAALLRERITSFLVQSRRFAVLDRHNDPVFKRELDLLRSADVPQQETLRIGQVLGADYIVLVKIRAFDTQTQSQTVRLTGRTVEQTSSLVNLDFSVFEVATRQVKWTGRFQEPQEGGLAQALDLAAARVGEDILNAIYPMLILQAEANGVVVINQGGETLRVGQQLAAFRLGEQMVDPYTKEPLGRAETPVASIVVERVDPKLSYGRVMSGQSLAGQGDIILRKRAASAQETQPAPAAPQATGNKPRW
jgi:hypothetical protein